MASEFLNFILAIVIVILAAKTGGYISNRLGQPSVLGELLAGLLMGPTVLDLLHSPIFAGAEHLGESITLMAELGVVLLMLLAGLELDLSELLRAGKVSAVAGAAGVIVPLGLGVGVAMLFEAGFAEALFVGLTLSATSVSISAQTLLELNVLRSRVGLALLGAAVFDDILVILILSISLVLVSDAGGLAPQSDGREVQGADVRSFRLDRHDRGLLWPAALDEPDPRVQHLAGPIRDHQARFERPGSTCLGGRTRPGP
jgi:Kef-type K+ transport system membrane component KefB